MQKQYTYVFQEEILLSNPKFLQTGDKMTQTVKGSCDNLTTVMTKAHKQKLVCTDV